MNFRPTIEPIKVLRKNILKKVTGSLKTIIPKRTVPTAPIPVQTTYTVPIGRVCNTLIKSPILMTIEMANPKYHKYISLPVASFAFPRHKAKITSNNPAITNKIQFITFFCKG